MNSSAWLARLGSRIPLDLRRIQQWLRLNPALPVAVSLMLGIATAVALDAWWLHVAVVLFVTAIIGAVIAIWFVHGKSRVGLGWTSIVCSVAALGTAWGGYHWTRLPNTDISHFVDDVPETVNVDVELIEPPRVLPRRERRPLVYAALGRVHAIETETGTQTASGRVAVLMQLPPETPKVGQRWRGAARLSYISPPRYPGQPDYRDYYRRQDVRCRVSFSNASRISVTPAEPSIITSVRERVRSAVIAGFDFDDAEERALLAALLLGESDASLRELREQFTRTGTLHHLAISGLHVGVLLGFVLLLARLARLTARQATVAGMGFLLLYALVVTPATPVFRALVIGLAWGASRLLLRRVSSVQLLSVAAILVLLVHPLELFSAGFALSFTAVLALMLLTRHVAELLHREDIDLTVLASFQQLSLARRARLAFGRIFRNAFSAALVAWTATLPIIALSFERFNPFATLAGMLLAIPVMLALMVGLLKLMSCLLIPSLAPAMAWLVSWPLTWMQSLLAGLDQLPLSDLPTTAPPLWLALLVYVLLLLPLLPYRGAQTPAYPARSHLLPRWSWISWLAGLLVAVSLPFWSDFSPRQPADPRIIVDRYDHQAIAIVQTPDRWIVLGQLTPGIESYHRYAGRPPMDVIAWDAAAPSIDGLRIALVTNEVGDVIAWNIEHVGRRITLAPECPERDLWQLADWPCDTLVLRKQRPPMIVVEGIRDGGSVVLLDLRTRAARSAEPLERGIRLMRSTDHNAIAIPFGAPPHPLLPANP